VVEEELGEVGEVLAEELLLRAVHLQACMKEGRKEGMTRDLKKVHIYISIFLYIYIDIRWVDSLLSFKRTACRVD